MCKCQLQCGQAPWDGQELVQVRVNLDCKSRLSVKWAFAAMPQAVVSNNTFIDVEVSEYQERYMCHKEKIIEQ